MPKILQVNLGRSRVAHDLTYVAAIEEKVDIVIIGEPNKQMAKKQGFIMDEEEVVAAHIINKSVGIAKHERGRGYIKLTFGDWSLYGCYISPNITTDEFEERLDGIMASAKREKKAIIIAGDLNSKSPLWGSPASDKRGEYVAEWAAELDLVFLNSGEHTFERGSTVSHIDVTCACQSMAMRTVGWKILEGEFSTHHRHILFTVKDKNHKMKPKTQGTGKRWLFNSEIFTEKIKGRQWGQGNGGNLKVFLDNMQEVVRESTTRIQATRIIPYWWNAGIEMARRKSTEARRTSIRRNRKYGVEDPRAQEATEEHRHAKKELNKLINQSKRESWKQTCKELEDDIWGNGYKIATKGLGIQSLPYNPPVEKKLEWCRQLFPKKENRRLRWMRIPTEQAPQFTIEELREAAGTIKNKKAPGPDGIPPEAVKIAVTEVPDAVLEVLNNLARDQSFPRVWKEASVILIWKGKDTDKASSFRPICLISVIGKLYEKMIKNRLERDLENKGGLSQNQYGFRKGRSTIHAIEKVLSITKSSRETWVAMVTVDIKNAFNSVPWDCIIDKLEEREVERCTINLVDSYLSHRKIWVDRGVSMEMSAGVPQGSVLGPILWNVMYDDLLNLQLTEGTSTVAFADDLAVLIEAKNAEDLMHRTNESLFLILDWMTKHGLQIAVQKTEAIVLKGPRKRNIRFNLRGQEISCVKQTKYLGVVLDDKLIFGPHVKYAVRRAESRLSALSRIMPNIGGPGNLKRRALYGVVQSILLYAAPVWIEALRMEKYKKMITSTQRKVLLRVTCGYRTASATAIQAIAGVPPITLLAEERNRLYLSGNGHQKQARDEERERTLDKWQGEWETAQGHTWTKRIIRNVKEWTKCAHRTTDYHLTQFLSGHGSFRDFTKRIQKTETSLCIYCAEEDSAEHTVLKCDRWVRQRTELELNINTAIDTDNIIPLMISDKHKWLDIHAYIKTIMTEKEQEERAMEERNRVNRNE